MYVHNYRNTDVNQCNVCSFTYLRGKSISLFILYGSQGSVFGFKGQNNFSELEHTHSSTIKHYTCMIKTHGSESRGQEEAACTRVFWPTRPLQ